MSFTAPATAARRASRIAVPWATLCSMRCAVLCAALWVVVALTACGDAPSSQGPAGGGGAATSPAAPSPPAPPVAPAPLRPPGEALPPDEEARLGPYPRSQFYIERDLFLAADEPATVPSAEASFLRESDEVLGFVIGGKARAYAVTMLSYHHVVNDVLAGIPVAVTY